MKIFVIHCDKPEYQNRLDKYSAVYEIFNSIDRDSFSIDEINEYKFYWNASELHRRKVVSCAESHYALWDKIIEEDLKDVVVLEDDCYIKDFDKLAELKGHNKFTYLGGTFAWKVKDIKDFQNFRGEEIGKSMTWGINKIKPEDEWIVSQTCAYYIPNAKEIKKIKDRIINTRGKKKKCAIDGELIKLQKDKVITDLYYPALGVLKVDEAKQGYTGYAVKSEQEFY
jgi:hypothetical protein